MGTTSLFVVHAAHSIQERIEAGKKLNPTRARGAEATRQKEERDARTRGKLRGSIQNDTKSIQLSAQDDTRAVVPDHPTCLAHVVHHPQWDMLFLSGRYA